MGDDRSHQLRRDDESLELGMIGHGEEAHEMIS